MPGEIKDVLKSMGWGLLLLSHLAIFLTAGGTFLFGDWKPQYAMSIVPIAQQTLHRFTALDVQPSEAFGRRGDDPRLLDQRKEAALREIAKECRDCDLSLYSSIDALKVKWKLEALSSPEKMSSYYRWFYGAKVSQLFLTAIAAFVLFALWRARKIGIFPYFATLAFAAPVFSFLMPFAFIWFDDIYMSGIPALNDRMFGFIIFAVVAPFLAWPPVFVLAKRRRANAA